MGWEPAHGNLLGVAEEATPEKWERDNYRAFGATFNQVSNTAFPKASPPLWVGPPGPRQGSGQRGKIVGLRK